MTPAERQLLRGVFRWGRAAGWRPTWPQIWALDGVTVDFVRSYVRRPSVGVWRRHDPGVEGVRRWANGNVQVVSVAEAVDLLVTLGILPSRFSTAYRAGWDAGREDSEHPAAGAEFRQIVPAAYLGPVRR